MSNVKYKNLKTLRFENRSPHEDPEYVKDTDSGFDLRAWIIEGSITLRPLERSVVHTGLYFELPDYTEIQVRPRSGMAAKRGLSVCNTPGTVDEGYRGEVCVIAVNLSNEDIVIEDGERIAQAALCPVYNGSLVRLEKIDGAISTDTDRGSDGFGSTGSI